MIFGASLAVALVVSETVDPTNSFTQLGVAAAVAVVLYMWLRDVGKQRDRMIDIHDAWTPLLTEIRDALRSLPQTQRDAAAALSKVAEALERVPTEAEMVRIRDALRLMDNPPPSPRRRSAE